MNLCSLNKKLLYILIKRNEEVIREKVQLPKKKRKNNHHHSKAQISCKPSQDKKGQVCLLIIKLFDL